MFGSSGYIHLPSGYQRRAVVICLTVVWIGTSFQHSLGQTASSEAARAEQALQGGHYLEARQLFRPHLNAEGLQEASLVLGYFKTFLATGEYQKGLNQVDAYLQQQPDNAYLLYAQGRLLQATGKYERAETAFQSALEEQPAFWRNILALAELYEQTGQQTDAERLYRRIYESYRQGQFRTAETLSIAARAAAALEQFHEANSAFRRAHALNPSHVRNLYWWAELFRKKYNVADARRTYEDALAINPRHAKVYVGLARTTNSFTQKEEFARHALEINPRSVGAMNVLAGLHILDGRYEEAEAIIREALAVNPSLIVALAHLASIHHLQGRTEAFAEIETRVLDINPHAGSFYLTLVDNCVHRFRYPAAADFARRAVEVDDDNWQAYAALGASLMRLGKTREARRYLEISFRNDPFNLFAGNTLTLLDERQQFDVRESRHFRLFIHPSESDVLGPAILSLAETCYDSLSSRYPYRPSGKIILEAYNDKGDFAVRVAGIPHLSLLGVSFGDVVAINTPRARSGQSYNWAQTLWHEIAHTMAIGLSNHRVPRWFTEGLSVYEQRRAHPAWGREMDLKLFAAFDQGRLLPLENIDRGFTRPQFPGQITLTYYHASKVIEFIVDRYGFDAIIEILSTLGEGNSIAESIEMTLDQSVASLDRAFRESLEEERRRFARALEDLPNLLSGSEEEDSLLEQLTGQSTNPFLEHLQAGNRLLENEQYEAAEEKFRQAIDVYPYYTGAGNAYQGLATIYRVEGDEEQLIEILERFLKLSENSPQASRELARLYQKRDNIDKTIHYLRRSLHVDPYTWRVRAELAVLYEGREQYARAVEHRRAVVALEPVDEAKALYRLAASLYLDDRPEEAKRAVIRSLEIAPGYEEAQRLLLQIVGTSK